VDDAVAALLRACLVASPSPLAELDVGTGEGVWTVERLGSLLEAYRAEHHELRFDPEARNLRYTHVAPAADGQRWRVQQVLVDDELHNDWMAEFDVDVAASRGANRPVLWLRALVPIG